MKMLGKQKMLNNLQNIKVRNYFICGHFSSPVGVPKISLAQSTPRIPG